MSEPLATHHSHDVDHEHLGEHPDALRWHLSGAGISFDEPHQWRWADVKTADLDDLRLIHVEEHTEREQRP